MLTEVLPTVPVPVARLIEVEAPRRTAVSLPAPPAITAAVVAADPVNTRVSSPFSPYK